MTPPEDAAPPEDTTRPTVVSISPADQAVGVSSDAKIVITFSEPMDLQATQLALQSPDLPVAAAVLTWNPDGTVLTITPDQPLAYATGSDPATVMAKEYRIVVSTVATDVHGNHLAETFMASFQTRRLIPLQLLADAAHTGCYSADFGEVPGNIFVGDTSSNDQLMGFVSFEITPVPTSARIESAKLVVELDGGFNEPDPLGVVTVDEAAFATLTEGFTAAPRRTLSVLLTPPVDFSVAAKTLDVGATVSDDVANRGTLGNLIQYRLHAALATDGNNRNDWYSFNQPGNPRPELNLTYSIE